MKKLPLCLILITLSLSLGAALEMTHSFDTNIIIREFDNPIEVELQITDLTPGHYNLYTLSDMSLEPKEIFKIDDEKEIQKTITFTPTENLQTKGLYSFTYNLNHREVEQIGNKLTIKLVDLKEALEVGAESVNIEKGEIIIYINNKENVEIKNIKVTFSSILFDTFDKKITIKPLEKNTITIKVDPETLKKTKAGNYVFESVFETPKGDREISGSISLGEKKGLTTEEESSGFFIKTLKITKINSGNILENVEISIEKNIFSRLFTSYNIAPTVKNRDGFGVTYTWIKEKLGPTETYVVEAKTNYVLPLLIIFFAIIAMAGYKRYSETKIKISKSAHPVKTKNGEFALKIKLSIKARKQIENVSLVDKIPKMVKVYKKFGTSHPDKIDAENRRIHWNIGDLSAGEERVFTYIVYSKVGIVGKFSLPEALAVFEHSGQIHEAESSKVFFMNDQVKE